MLLFLRNSQAASIDFAEIRWEGAEFSILMIIGFKKYTVQCIFSILYRVYLESVVLAD
jgi:hypothetical protein